MTRNTPSIASISYSGYSHALAQSHGPSYWARACFTSLSLMTNPEADKLAAVLQSIIDSACHPDIALRVISVELAPIRKALADYRKTLPEGQRSCEAAT